MKIRHKDFDLAKDNILEAFKKYTGKSGGIPPVFDSRPPEYLEFLVRSAIIGEISKLERMVFEEKD